MYGNLNEMVVNVIKPGPKDNRLDRTFFLRPALVVAPELLGKLIVRRFDDGSILRIPVTEVEVYLGIDDRACHASRGMTPRNRVMFGEGGILYMYLIYGIHWMLNIVTGGAGQPEALLIRGAGAVAGPGKLTALLRMDGSFYGEDLSTSDRVWIEDAPAIGDFTTGPRVGINYAGEPWISKPWRYWCNLNFKFSPG